MADLAEKDDPELRLASFGCLAQLDAPAGDLQVLDLSGVALWSSGVVRLAGALQQLPKLHTLLLSDVHLAHTAVGESGGRTKDLAGATALGKSLENRFAWSTGVVAVETLDLSRNELDSSALHAALAYVRGLTALDVRKNKLKGRAGAAQLRAIAQRNELQHLHTAANGVDVVRRAHRQAFDFLCACI